MLGHPTSHKERTPEEASAEVLDIAIALILAHPYRHRSYREIARVRHSLAVDPVATGLEGKDRDDEGT